MNNKSHLHTQQAGATLPLLQAVITGGLVGLIVLVLTLWQRVRDGLIYALLAWLTVSCITWLVLQYHWYSLTAIERFTGVDIDQDGYIGEPVQEPASLRHVVTVDIRQKNEGGFDQIKTATLPFSEQDMRLLATGLLAGKSFSEREWTGAGKLLSVGQFREARAEMIRRGMLELVNSKDVRQGYRLTKAGAAVMRHFQELSPSE